MHLIIAVLVSILKFIYGEREILGTEWNLESFFFHPKNSTSSAASSSSSSASSRLHLNFSIQHDIDHSLRENNVITINLNLTVIEYFHRKKIFLSNLFLFQQLMTIELLTNLCLLDSCPYCQGTGRIFCSSARNTSSSSQNLCQPREEDVSSPSGQATTPNSQESSSITTEEEQGILKLISEYSFPCPYCQGYGKIDESRQRVIELYEQGIFQRYPTYFIATTEYLQYLSTDYLTNQTKRCLEFCFKVKEFIQKPYYLDLPPFLHPLYPVMPLIYHLPISFASMGKGELGGDGSAANLEGGGGEIAKGEPKIIEIRIQDLENYHLLKTSDLLLSFQKNQTNFFLQLDISLTPEEIFHGFEKQIPLFPSSSSHHCQPFTINRLNQFTMPNSTVSIPLTMLFHHLCEKRSTEASAPTAEAEDEDELYKLSSTNYDILYPKHLIGQQLQVHFHLYAESLVYKQLQDKWYCKDDITYEDQRTARLQNLQYILHQFVYQNTIKDIYWY